MDPKTRNPLRGLDLGSRKVADNTLSFWLRAQGTEHQVARKIINGIKHAAKAGDHEGMRMLQAILLMHEEGRPPAGFDPDTFTSKRVTNLFNKHLVEFDEPVPKRLLQAQKGDKAWSGYESAADLSEDSLERQRRANASEMHGDKVVNALELRKTNTKLAKLAAAGPPEPTPVYEKLIKKQAKLQASLGGLTGRELLEKGVSKAKSAIAENAPLVKDDPRPYTKTRIVGLTESTAKHPIFREGYALLNGQLTPKPKPEPKRMTADLFKDEGDLNRASLKKVGRVPPVDLSKFGYPGKVGASGAQSAEYLQEEQAAEMSRRARDFEGTPRYPDVDPWDRPVKYEEQVKPVASRLTLAEKAALKNVEHLSPGEPHLQRTMFGINPESPREPTDRAALEKARINKAIYERNPRAVRRSTVVANPAKEWDNYVPVRPVIRNQLMGSLTPTVRPPIPAGVEPGPVDIPGAQDIERLAAETKAMFREGVGGIKASAIGPLGRVPPAGLGKAKNLLKGGGAAILPMILAAGVHALLGDQGE